MQLFVSHMSALRYWRQQEGTTTGTSVKVPSIKHAVTNVKDARLFRPREHGLIMSSDHPMDIVVPDASERRYSKELHPHLWKGPIPENAFLRIAPSIYVSTPEFVFVQLASEYSVVELAQIGNELCGGYYLLATSGFVQREGRVSLTTRERLAAFVDKNPGMRGVKNARRALRWIADGCDSPQETISLLALCLPMHMDGWGLRLPEVNAEVEVGKRLASYVGGTVYRPDFLWTRKVGDQIIRVAGEYDSSEHHDEEGDAEHTRIRRNDMKAMGYLVTSINRSQISNAELFQYPARQIARDLGIYRPAPDAETLARQNELLRKLREERFR